MTIRKLTRDDRDPAKALWQNTFDDTQAFVDWFFRERFLPEWSVGVFDGNSLISAIHGTPMRLSAGNTFFTALMTSGVATLPSERGKGYMHAAMRYLQHHAETKGIRALFNHPQRPGAYAHLGFKPMTLTKYWHGHETTCSGKAIRFSEVEAFRIYSALSFRYAGFAIRDQDSFHLKMEDYASDGAGSFMVEENGETVGYCIYFEKEGVYGEEVLSLKGYGALLHELKRIALGKNVTAKLPPDADAEGKVMTQNVMLAGDDIWEALESSGLPRFCVDEY